MKTNLPLKLWPYHNFSIYILTIGQLYSKYIISGSVLAHLDRGEDIAVGFLNPQQASATVVDIDALQILTLDVHDVASRIRIDDHLSLLIVVDTDIEQHMECQVDDAVAAILREEVYRIMLVAHLGRGDVHAVTGIVLIDNDAVFHLYLIRRVDGEVEYVHAVAAAGSCEVVVVGTCCVVAMAVPLVRRVRAGVVIRHKQVGTVHGQNQVHHAVAAAQRLQLLLCIHRTISLRQGVEAELLVSITQTDGVHDGGGQCRVHRQRQLEHAVATRHLAVQAVPHDVRARRRRDGHIGVACPNVRNVVARRGGGLGIVGRVHRQRQFIHAVAVVHRLQAVPQDVRTRRRRDGHIRVALPYIRLIVARLNRRCIVECRIHRQHQHVGAVATGRGLLSVIIHIRLHTGCTMPIVRQFAVAYRHRVTVIVRRVHRQRQLIDAVATRHHTVQAVPNCVGTHLGRDRHVRMVHPNIRFVVTRRGG